MDLSLYLSELNSIRKDLRLDSDSYLDVQLRYLNNYLDQMTCVKSLELFDTDSEGSEEEAANGKQQPSPPPDSNGIYLENNSNILIEKRELKLKLLYKLNMLLSEKFEEIQKIFNSIESKLTQMSHQHQLAQDEKENAESVTSSKTDENSNLTEIDYYKLGLAMLKINKTFWTNFYDLKAEFALENLRKSKNTDAIRNILNKWLNSDTAHLQVDLELCRHYASVLAARRSSSGRKLAAPVS